VYETLHVALRVLPLPEETTLMFSFVPEGSETLPVLVQTAPPELVHVRPVLVHVAPLTTPRVAVYVRPLVPLGSKVRPLIVIAWLVVTVLAVAVVDPLPATLGL
jgi:hypothetical protein